MRYNFSTLSPGFLTGLFSRSRAGRSRAVAAMLLLASACASAQTAPDPASSQVGNAVVKIFSTVRHADPFKPWAKQGPQDVTGSGVVIEGRRILTNAHVVLNASQIDVQANQVGDKLPATVVAISPGMDLAVLKLDDETFFKTHPPLERAKVLPEIRDAVLTYGFPTGGTSLSITKGIVSRIEFVPYNFPVAGLRIQIDAAINPGNSGGPAIAGDKMIGLAFATLNGAQNIGYIIPNEEIDLFLQDIADGRYDGKPAMYDDLQTLENPALRAFLKLDKDVKGMVVHHPYLKDANYPLKEWDVITHVGQVAVDDQGMIKVGPDLRVDFRYMVQKLAQGGKVPLRVVRAGKAVALELPLSTTRPMLVPDLAGSYPPYFIYGPLVFSRATAQFASFLTTNAGAAARYGFIGSPLVTRRGEPPKPEREELVVISSPFFPHKLAKGYSNAAGSVVYAINGQPVRSLSHLVALLRDIREEFVTVETESRGGETMVFVHKDMVAATDDILSDNGVRAQGSPDMMAIWRAAQAGK
jgi:S1-C subfamily serine protease